MITSTIKDSRLILGLFRDLEKRGQSVIIDETDYTASISVTAKDSKHNAEFDLVITTDTIMPNSIHVAFWIDHDYFKCTLERKDELTFLAPAEVHTIERRRVERICSSDLEEETTVVISLSQEKIFGRLKDISKDYISVISSSKTSLTDGQGQLTLFQKGQIVGDHPVAISKISQINDELSLLFKLQTPSESGNKRNTHRGSKIESVALNLCWPNEEGFSSLIRVTEISGLGMSGEAYEGALDLLPIGTVFVEKATEARIRLAWRNESMVGFSFDTTEPALREKIISTVLDLSSIESRFSEKRKSKRSLHILTRSGLLKGSRALSYANKSKEELFYNRAKYSARWFYQIQSSLNFLSFLRVSDDGWLIQEIASSGAKGSGEGFLLDGVHSFIRNMNEEANPFTSIIVIYDTSSRFNNEMWRNRIPELFSNEASYREIILGSIKGCRLTEKSDHPSIICKSVNSRDWFEESKRFENDDVMNAFGISQQHFSSMTLANILRSNSLRLDRSVHLIMEKNSVLAVVLKLGLPSISSATSLAENLYIFHLQGDLHQYLNSFLFNGSPMLIGIEDICIISKNKTNNVDISSIINGFTPRIFELALLPINAFKMGNE